MTTPALSSTNAVSAVLLVLAAFHCIQRTASEDACLPWPTDEAIFLHIPKTGGASLQAIMDAYIKVLGKRVCPIKNVSDKRQHLESYAQDDSCLLAGHFEFGVHKGSRPCSYVSFLRDPVDRQISNYFFMRARNRIGNGTLREWMHRAASLQQVSAQWICGTAEECTSHKLSVKTLQTVKENVNTCFPLVGITEVYDHSLKLLQRFFPAWVPKRLHSKHINRQKRDALEAVSEWDKDRYRVAHALDQVLYEWALRRVLLQLRSCDIYIPSELYTYLLTFTSSEVPVVDGACPRVQERNPIFLHIPKTGGTTLAANLRAMTEFFDVGMCYYIGDSLVDMSEWRRVLQRHPQCLLAGHFHFGIHNASEYYPVMLQHRSDAPRDGLSSLDNTERRCSYTTILRDPLQRQISLYYHLRGMPHLDSENRAQNRSLKEFLEAVQPAHQEQVFRLCGFESLCLQRNDAEAALRKAVENIEACFPVVGTTEQFDIYYRVLHLKYPHWFPVPHPPLTRQNVNPDEADAHEEASQLPFEVLDRMKRVFKEEYQLYEFVSLRLGDMAKKCGLEVIA